MVRTGRYDRLSWRTLPLLHPEWMLLMLAELNDRWTRPNLDGVLPLLVFVAASLFFGVYMQLKNTLHEAPRTTDDASDYDLIAWGIVTGQGFTRDNQSPEFQSPYRQAGSNHEFSLVSGPVTDRPPLYPLVLAVTFRSGRQFHVIRIVQALLLALVIATVARLAYDRAGVIPALLCPILMLIVDPRPRTMVPEILTESLASGLVMLLFLRFAKWDRHRRMIDAVMVGGSLGLLVMCRTMMVLWLPVLVAGMWFLTEKPDRWKSVRQGLVMGTVTVMICLPWWIHNVRVLGEFRPLGTQGAEQLSAAYSDEAFRRLGMWFNQEELGFFRGIETPDPVRRSLDRAERSELSARQWVAHHPLKAALLWPARVFQEFRPHGPGDLFVLAFSLLGLAILWDTPEGRAARWLCAGQVFAIAATWSVAGRFVYPLLGMLHLLAVVGLWGAYVAVVEKRELSRAWVIRP
jgi:4-amino-4-deoxy-L-arabinose transferase-like glycosyltransferase